MSSVASLGSAAAYSQAAQGKIDLGVTLAKIASNSDNAMAGVLDKLVQQGQEAASVAPEGMGGKLDIKA